MDRGLEFIEGPLANSCLGIGRDIGRVNRSEWRVDPQPAGELLIRRSRVTGHTIPSQGEVAAVLHEAGVGVSPCVRCVCDGASQENDGGNDAAADPFGNHLLPRRRSSGRRSSKALPPQLERNSIRPSARISNSIVVTSDEGSVKLGSRSRCQRIAVCRRGEDLVAIAITLVITRLTGDMGAQ